MTKNATPWPMSLPIGWARNLMTAETRPPMTMNAMNP